MGIKDRLSSGSWRTRVAQLLWTLCVLAALVLAVGALLVAIDANEDNGLVSLVREFSGESAETKNALVNWGLGAVVYLLVGRLLERVVRPGA